MRLHTYMRFMTCYYSYSFNHFSCCYLLVCDKILLTCEWWDQCRMENQVHYTLFANNSEIGAKWRKNNVQRIVYKRHLPCFANKFFAVRCMLDLRRGSGLVDEHKVFFCWKKSFALRKLMANNEQCTATRSSHFRQQYFIPRKNNFVPYSSCSRIVYSGLNTRQFPHYTAGCVQHER